MGGVAAATKNYVIEKRGSEWCLLTKDGSRVLGCHDSHAGAARQEAAIEAAKAARNNALREIKGVEIFRSGTWNGDEYSEDDLDLIVAAANQVGFGIPLKAGHRDNAGEPALGWVENLRREGSNLYGDLTSLPEKVFEAIRDRAYDAVSAEIFWDLERNGVKHPRALKALALLGAEIPAVDLAPLRSALALNAMPPRRAAHVYETELKLLEAVPPTGRDAHPDGSMDADDKGECPEGYEKGEDGRCHMKKKDMAQDAAEDSTRPAEVVHTTTETTAMATPATTPSQDTPVRDGEIVVRMSEIAELRRKADKAERLESLQADLMAEKAKHEALEQQRREDRIAYKLRDVKLPVFRPYIKALYEVAQGAPAVKKYTVADRQADAEGIVELLVVEINKQAEHLFATLSIVDQKNKHDPDEPDDTQGKIAYRVNAYCRAQKLDPRKDYKAAMEAVLAADPDLKRDYAAL